MVQPRTTIGMAAGTDLVVEGAVHLVFFGAMDPRQVLRHFHCFRLICGCIET